MHNALGDSLVIKMKDLFAKREIFEQDRPRGPFLS